MRKKTNAKQREATHQRSAKPDELVMVCNDNPLFGHKFAEIFRGIKSGREKANE